MSLPRIPVAQPQLDGRERDYVLDCLDSGWISSSGRYLAAFEAAFAAACGVRHAIACNNGTTALHLALVALGLGPGDEVIVPTLTYIASANTVTYCGATPVFVDSEPQTLNLDPAQIAAKLTPRTRGIMPVHLYGHPADMAPIRALAQRHNLFVLEDAAEAIGARVAGRAVGGLGDAAAFSLFGNKIITTGEGGVVTTDDDALAARLRLYRGQGMDPQRRYWFPVIGFNYRMTNLAAAIGLAQVERLDAHLASRRRVAEGYARRLAPLAHRLSAQGRAPWADPVCWMYTVVLAEDAPLSRDALMAALEAEGIETRPLFHPLHTLPPYAPLGQRGFPVAESAAARGLNLPTYAALGEDDLDRIVDALTRLLA